MLGLKIKRKVVNSMKEREKSIMRNRKEVLVPTQRSVVPMYVTY